MSDLQRSLNIQYTSCSLGSGLINTPLGTVFLDTLPRVNIRRLCIRASPKRGRYWEILRVQGNLEGGGEIILNTSRVFVECGHSLIINLRSAIDLSQGPMAPQVKVPCAASQGPMWCCELRSLGPKLIPKNVQFRAFIGPSGQNQLYHTPLLLKI